MVINTRPLRKNQLPSNSFLYHHFFFDTFPGLPLSPSAQTQSTTTSYGWLPCHTHALISSQVLVCVEIVSKSFLTSLIEDIQLSCHFSGCPGLTRSVALKCFGKNEVPSLHYSIEYCQMTSPEGYWIACTGKRVPFGLTWELLELHLGAGLFPCSVEVSAQTQQGWPLGIRGPIHWTAPFTGAHPNPPKDAPNNAHLSKVT